MFAALKKFHQEAKEIGANQAAVKHDAQAQIVCPHCLHRGRVRATPTKRKRGISGGKATGALLTGGASMFVTGLSRKEHITEMHCSNCSVKWDV